MRKKMIAFIIIIFLLFPTVILGESYYCSYDAKFSTYFFNFELNRNELELGIIIDTDKKEFKHDKSNDALISLFENSFVLDGYLDSKYGNDETIISDLSGECPQNIYICKFTHLSPGGNSNDVKYGIIFKPTLYSKIAEKNTYTVNLNDNSYAWGTQPQKNCEIANYNESRSTAKSNNEIFQCDYYNEVMNGTDTEKGLKDLYCSPGKTDCNNEKYNANKQKLIDYCSLIMNRADYTNPCIQSCNKMRTEISTIEGEMDLNKCGLSETLVAWILNIIKWVKYIIPVIVILMGILDFMRAVSSDKDDGMKKAQGRFVKRLIAAALIFIVPFILEFILEKFGISVENCGIEGLF